MSEIKIGFFSLQDGTGCTSFANHAANHLVAGENKVALIEPDTVIEKEYSTVKAEFADDGTFYLNEVHYYPAGATTEPEETIEIYDFGKITIFHEFEKDFDKLYLCTDGTGKDIPDIKEYLLESQIQYELIIPGASKDIFNAYKELGNKVISVGGKKETVCPYDLALRLNLILRSKGLVPPEYHKEWEYAPIIFHYVPEEEK